ncbi:MAG TPA: hypothetical protein VFV10_12765, partial [Gammaproteobacteria bacterium]|nr:hypothetical protein [Gammaproteobacteria bacterium]
MSGEQEQIRFIEDAIRGQRQLRRLQLALAILAVVLGVALMVVLQWFRVGIVEDNVKLFGQLGGAFVATLSSFP